jgi:hypothetical protein
MWQKYTGKAAEKQAFPVLFLCILSMASATP